MSKLLPASVAEVIRTNTDVLINSVGLACTIQKIQTQVDADVLGDDKTTVYASPVSTYVAVVWSPEVRKLKSLGLYQEGAPLPILCYTQFGDDLNIGDILEFEHEYAVGTSKTNRFYVTDIKLVGFGAEVRQIHIISPKRA